MTRFSAARSGPGLSIIYYLSNRCRQSSSITAVHLASINGLAEHAEPDRREFARIHRLLKRQAGHDFSQYKEGTIARRVERRMRTLQIESVRQYIERAGKPSGRG